MATKGNMLSCQSDSWKKVGGNNINLLGEFIAGFQQTVQMVDISKGACFISGVSTGSLNNYDSLVGHIYAENGFWYLTTRHSHYNRGQTLRAICVG